MRHDMIVRCVSPIVEIIFCHNWISSRIIVAVSAYAQPTLLLKANLENDATLPDTDAFTDTINIFIRYT